MIIDETELMGRLRDVDELPPEVSERAMQTLRAAMLAAEAPDALSINASGRLGRVRHPRRLVAAVVGCAAALVAVLGALALSPGGEGLPPTTPSQASRPPATRSIPGQTLRLASYTFQLPAGYTSVASDCTALPTSLGPTIPVDLGAGSPTAAAASADGGCIEAVLVGQQAPMPSGAEAVEVGPYSGFVLTSPSSGVDLYVEIPAFRGHHDLVLAAEGLTADQVVSIAKSGLPSSLGPVESCTTNCG